VFQLINNGIYLDTTYNLEGERKDERIGQVANRLEDGDVLHKGAVPHEAEKECADEHNK
jgi:hypothetical protein